MIQESGIEVDTVCAPALGGVLAGYELARSLDVRSIFVEKKEGGMELHPELLFKKTYLKAYPSVGADINLNGDTSFFYGGFSWEGQFFEYLSLGAFFGPSIHDGESDNGASDKRQLGSRILIRAAIDIGVYLTDDITLSFMYDHYSNTGLFEKRNQGNDNMGLRLSLYL